MLRGVLRRRCSGSRDRPDRGRDRDRGAAADPFADRQTIWARVRQRQRARLDRPRHPRRRGQRGRDRRGRADRRRRPGRARGRLGDRGPRRRPGRAAPAHAVRGQRLRRPAPGQPERAHARRGGDDPAPQHTRLRLPRRGAAGPARAGARAPARARPGRRRGDLAASAAAGLQRTLRDGPGAHPRARADGAGAPGHRGRRAARRDRASAATVERARARARARWPRSPSAPTAPWRRSTSTAPGRSTGRWRRCRGRSRRCATAAPLLSALVDRTGELAVDAAPGAARARAGAARAAARSSPRRRRPSAAPCRWCAAIATVLRRATAAAPGFERLLEVLRPAPADPRRAGAARRMHREVAARPARPTCSWSRRSPAATRPCARTRPRRRSRSGSGHMIRLGAYFDPAGLDRSPACLPCGSIAQLDPTLAASPAAGSGSAHDAPAARSSSSSPRRKVGQMPLGRLAIVAADRRRARLPRLHADQEGDPPAGLRRAVHRSRSSSPTPRASTASTSPAPRSPGRSSGRVTGTRYEDGRAVATLSWSPRSAARSSPTRPPSCGRRARSRT